MTSSPFRLGAIAVVLALTGAACSSGADNATPPSNTPDMSESMPPDTTENTADTGASALRATLTAGLQEHEFLAGIALFAAVKTGLDSDVTTQAVAALDENSVALSEAIASVYGDSAGDAFLPLWRKHIGFFVDYTVAKVKDDAKSANKAKKGLDAYRADFGAFLASANPNLTKAAVADALLPHVTSTFKAIDSIVANKSNAFSLLRDGAAKLAPVAEVLADAIVRQFPDKFDGDATSGGAALRSTLHGGLQEHEYLAGITIFNGVTFGLKSPEFKNGAAALDENSVALSKAIGSVYGAPAEKAFLPLWRKHIGFFVAYTAAAAEGDDKAKEAARKDLDGYRSDFGAFLASANPNLTKDAVAEALLPHVTSTFDAIDAVVAGDADRFSKLRVGAAKLGPVGEVLASAIVAQFPDKF